MSILTAEQATHIGVFHTWDNPEYTTGELRSLLRIMRQRAAIYRSMPEIGDIVGLKNYERHENILMASQKLAMANAVYPSIDKLVITTQSTTPSDDETSYSGTLYTTVAADEFYRSANTNPFTAAWNIPPTEGNGTWGSLILITAAGGMINRALANVTKTSGVAKIVYFEGLVS